MERAVGLSEAAAGDMRDFFEAFERQYAKAIPTHKQGWPDYWTDGVASTAFETGHQPPGP